jgi:phosphoribosylanthranilate isomerase
MTWVKICGITSPEDAVAAADLGAVAIGMVFWPESPRCVDRARAREIVAALPPFVAAVGVFVNQVQEAAAIARDVGLTAVQFHGDESPTAYRGWPIQVIKAVTVRDGSALEEAGMVPDEATVLLDAHDRVKRGGTGRVIDWEIAAMVARSRRTILSGGLSAANVAEAIALVRPYAVDVSSGVESSPGVKDHTKLRALFEAIGRE